MEHKIHVESGPEYQGELYLWCECKTKQGSLANCYYLNLSDREALFDGGEDLIWRNGGPTSEEALTALIAWLTEHGAFAGNDSVRAVAAAGVTG